MTAGTTTLAIQALLDRLKDSPDDAQLRKELIASAYERLATVARRLLGPAYRSRPEDTSGLLAEAYLRLESSLGQVKPDSVRQFLGLAALQMRRALIDLVRAQKGRDGGRAAVVPLPGGDSDAGGSQLPEDSVDAPDWRIDLMDAIEKLAEDERETVNLLFFHGLTQLEVAGLLGIDESTVKRRWAKARVRLAKWLAAFEGE